MEIKIYKQRVKHLLHEQQDDITSKNMAAEVSLKLAQVRIINIKKKYPEKVSQRTGKACMWYCRAVDGNIRYFQTLNLIHNGPYIIVQSLLVGILRGNYL